LVEKGTFRTGKTVTQAVAAIVIRRRFVRKLDSKFILNTPEFVQRKHTIRKFAMRRRRKQINRVGYS
jgi:hypothetical protein